MSGFSVGIQKQKISAAKAFRPVQAKGELSRAVLPDGYGKALLWMKNLQFLVVGQFGFPQLRSRNFYPCRPERHLATAQRERGRVEGPRECFRCHAATGNSTDDLLGFALSLSANSVRIRNAWVELPEAVWTNEIFSRSFDSPSGRKAPSESLDWMTNNGPRQSRVNSICL